MRASRSLVAAGVDHQQGGVRVALGRHAGERLLEPRARVVGHHDHHDRRDDRLDLDRLSGVGLIRRFHDRRTVVAWSGAAAHPGRAPGRLRRALESARLAACRRLCHDPSMSSEAVRVLRNTLLRQRRLRGPGLPEGPGPAARARGEPASPRSTPWAGTSAWSPVTPSPRTGPPPADHYAPAGCDSPSTPPPCSGPGPASGCSPPRSWPASPGRPGPRRRRLRGDLAGSATSSPPNCRPGSTAGPPARWPPARSAAPGPTATTRRSSGGPARSTSSTGPTSSCPPAGTAADAGHHPRPHLRALPRAVHPRHARVPRPHPPGPRPRRHGPRGVAVRGRRGAAPPSPSTPSGSW